METGPAIKFVIAVTSIYLFFVGAVMQFLPELGKTQETKT